MQMIFRKTKLYATVATLFLLLFGIFGGHAVLSQTSPSDSLAVREARRNWLQADLTLDNAAYAATRSAIDKQVRSGVRPDTLVQRYRLQDKDSSDNRKIFRWAYAVYRQQKAKPNRNILLDVNSVMERNLKPGAYDWIRLRFLIAGLAGLERGDALVPVGRRLLTRKYDDEEVMFHYVRALTTSGAKEGRRVALALAREQANEHPKDVYWQWMVADATDSYFDYGGTLTYQENQQVVAELMKTLRMLPAKHPERKRLIEAIVIWQTGFDANGKRQDLSAAEINSAIANTTLR